VSWLSQRAPQIPPAEASPICDINKQLKRQACQIT
jgi:hypothetical protein